MFSFRPLALAFPLLVTVISNISPAKEQFEWDLHKHMAWLPPMPTELTPEMRDCMAKFNSLYRADCIKPNGKGVKPEEFNTLMADVNRIMPWNPDESTGRLPMSLPGAKKPPQGAIPINDVLRPLFGRVRSAYQNCSPEQRPGLASAYRRIVQCVLEARLFPGAPMDGWLGNGYDWREWAQGLFVMDDTLPATERNLFAESVFYLSEGSKVCREMPYANSDIYLNYFPTMLRAVARMDDGPVKWQRLLMIRRGFDLSTISKDPYLTPDGGIIHHGGHHISYAGYSFAPAMRLHREFSSTGIRGPHTMEALSRFRRAAEMWAFTTLGKESPWPMQLRPWPITEKNRLANSEPGLATVFAKDAAELTAVLTGKPVSEDKWMARIAGSKTCGDPKLMPDPWKALATPEMLAPLDGHRVFPVMGASIHRKDGWTAVIRGANRFFRGGEVYADAPYEGGYLRHIMEGALFIYSTGREGIPPNSADSGFRTEGFDPNMMPNVTAPMISNPDLAARGNPDYMGSDAKQGGGTTLDDCGVWSWAPNKVRKSAFFFGNRITLITRGGTMAGSDVRTTLFQQVDDAIEKLPVFIGDVPRSKPFEETIPSSADKPLTLIDSRATGYFIPPGNPPLHVRLGVQGYTYARKDMVKPGVDFEKLGPIKNRNDLKRVIDNFNPIERPALVAWFTHGESPKETACDYSLLVKTKPEELVAFGKAMTGPNETKPFIQRIQPAYHYLADRATGIRALACFEPFDGADLPQVVSINRPSTVMWKLENNRLRISIASTDLSDSQPFRIGISGTWKPATPESESGVVVTRENNRSVLSIPYQNQCPVEVVLER